jgi:hypothetical protein
LNPIGFLGCPLILEMEFFGDRLGSKLSKVSIGYLEIWSKLQLEWDGRMSFTLP